MNKKVVPSTKDLDYVSVDPEALKKDPQGVNRAVAAEIVKKGIPVRGIEVAFLRKSLGMTYSQFGKKIGVNASTVMRWEEKKNTRLQLVSEIAVRVLVAESLELKKDSFSFLNGKGNKISETMAIDLSKKS